MFVFVEWTLSVLVESPMAWFITHLGVGGARQWERQRSGWVSSGNANMQDVADEICAIQITLPENFTAIIAIVSDRHK
jgi:hypothetical protein